MTIPRFELSALAEWMAVGDRTYGVSRSALGVAQGASLVAMAFCYFLAPQFAWVYPILAVVGFVALALPAVTSGPLGKAGQRLVDASPGRWYLPGGTGWSLRIVSTLLVSLAAPALVAAVLPAPLANRSSEPWVAISCLLVMAGSVVGVASAAGPSQSGLTRCGVVAIAAFLVAFLADLPCLPSLP